MVNNLSNSQATVTSNGCRRVFAEFYWYCPTFDASFYTNLVVFIANILIAAVGTPANVLVITAYGRNKNLRRSTDVLFLVLAITDVVVTGFVQPTYAVLNIVDVYESHQCNVVVSLNGNISYLCAGLSLLTIIIVSVERYISLAYPYRYPSLVTLTRVKLTVVLIWLLPFLFALLSAIRLVTFRQLLIVLNLMIFLSVATIVSIWIWIHRLVCRHRKMIATFYCPLTAGQESFRIKKGLRSTRTSYLIAGSVLFCYSPAFVLVICKLVGLEDFLVFKLVTPWGHTLVYGNSSVNPMLLFWRKRDLRETARKLLFRQTKKR